MKGANTILLPRLTRLLALLWDFRILLADNKECYPNEKFNNILFNP